MSSLMPCSAATAPRAVCRRARPRSPVVRERAARAAPAPAATSTRPGSACRRRGARGRRRWRRRRRGRRRARGWRGSPVRRRRASSRDPCVAGEVGRERASGRCPACGGCASISAISGDQRSRRGRLGSPRRRARLSGGAHRAWPVVVPPRAGGHAGCPRRRAARCRAPPSPTAEPDRRAQHQVRRPAVTGRRPMLGEQLEGAGQVRRERQQGEAPRRAGPRPGPAGGTRTRSRWPPSEGERQRSVLPRPRRPRPKRPHRTRRIGRQMARWSTATTAARDDRTRRDRPIPDPGFAGDDGAADPRARRRRWPPAARGLRGSAGAGALAALQDARLLVPGGRGPRRGRGRRARARPRQDQRHGGRAAAGRRRPHGAAGLHRHRRRWPPGTPRRGRCRSPRRDRGPVGASRTAPRRCSSTSPARCGSSSRATTSRGSPAGWTAGARGRIRRSRRGFGPTAESIG